MMVIGSVSIAVLTLSHTKAFHTGLIVRLYWQGAAQHRLQRTCPACAQNVEHIAQSLIHVQSAAVRNGQAAKPNRWALT